MRTIWTLVAAALMLAPHAASAQQQPRPIRTAADAAWMHARSGVALPARVGALPRVAILDTTTSEVDVAAHYGDQQTRVSIILFRPQFSDPGLWFDRADQMIDLNPVLGTVTRIEPAPVAFTLPGDSAARGLRRTYRGTGQWRSSATALVQVGRWFVKVRASSATADDAAISALVDAALNGVTLPAERGAAPVLRAVIPCADTVRWRTARVEQDSTGSVLGSLLMGRIRESRERPAAPGNAAAAAAQPEGEPVTDSIASHLSAAGLCRDATRIEGVPGHVYRVPGDADRYWIAVGDGGTLVAVERSDVASEIAGSARYAVTLHDARATLAYASYTSLPSPAQVVQMLTSSQPSGATAYDPEQGSANSIQISPNR